MKNTDFSDYACIRDGARAIERAIGGSTSSVERGQLSPGAARRGGGLQNPTKFFFLIYIYRQIMKKLKE